MKNSKEIGQSIYLKECLRDSYFSLLEKKSAESISVSEIAKLAGVSRMSFYRYYQTKEDIVRQYIEDSSTQFMAAIKRNPIKSPEVSATLLFRYFRSNENQTKILIEQNLFHLFFESFSQFLQESNLEIDSNPNIPQGSVHYYYQYTSGGILNLIKSWVSGQMKESDEEMALILRQIKEAQSGKYR